MPLDYHPGNVTFRIFQTAERASACARISLSDEAEKRKRKRDGAGMKGGSERGTEGNEG